MATFDYHRQQLEIDGKTYTIEGITELLFDNKNNIKKLNKIFKLIQQLVYTGLKATDWMKNPEVNKNTILGIIQDIRDNLNRIEEQIIQVDSPFDDDKL